VHALYTYCKKMQRKARTGRQTYVQKYIAKFSYGSVCLIQNDISPVNHVFITH